MNCSNCKKAQDNDVFVHGIDLCPRCERLLEFGEELRKACIESVEAITSWSTMGKYQDACEDGRRSKLIGLLEKVLAKAAGKE